MKILRSLLVLLVLVSASPAQQYKIENKASMRAFPFSPEQVRLLDSPFKRAEQLDVDVLLKISPDRLLSNYRKNAGLKAKIQKQTNCSKL